jgi:hypothetical protein
MQPVLLPSFFFSLPLFSPVYTLGTTEMVDKENGT